MNQERDHDHSESFVKGAVLLGVSGIFVKILGAFFKIPLGNILGPEGMSYYVSAYPIYNFFIVLATAGLPTALAKIISEQRALGNYRNMDKTFISGMILMTSIGLSGAIFMYFGAEYLVQGIKNPQAIYSFKALAPAIFLVSILAVFRGYFQGFQHLKPFAVSQIIEQLGRVIIGYGLAVALLRTSTALSAAGATFGATSGALAGLVVIVFMYKKFRKKNDVHFDSLSSGEVSSSTELIKRIVLIAVPITLGAAVMPLMNTIDVVLVMNRLHDIGIVENANDLYGMLVGYAATLVNLPQVVTAAIQISIVPAIAGLYVKKNNKDLNKTIQSGVRMALIVSLPATAGLVVLARPIMELLYPRQIEHAATTGAILSILGFGVVFLGLFQVTTGILQGLSLQNRPAINLAMGAISKILLTYILVGIPSINIYGAAFSSVVAYAVAAILNLMTLKRRAEIVFDVREVLIKPLMSVAVMSVVVLLAYHGSNMILPGKYATVFGISIGIITYFYMLLYTKTLVEEDFEMLPGGKKLRKINERYFDNK
ncbi:MAG: polysaccharide biosynthesis protein [Clostridia bacterium]|nr:polysaccharide biosynthesis protein [Clostridia bacterium]